MEDKNKTESWEGIFFKVSIIRIFSFGLLFDFQLGWENKSIRLNVLYSNKRRRRESFIMSNVVVFMLLVNLLKNLEQSTFSKHIMNNKQGKSTKLWLRCIMIHQNHQTVPGMVWGNNVTVAAWYIVLMSSVFLASSDTDTRGDLTKLLSSWRYWVTFYYPLYPCNWSDKQESNLLSKSN